MELVHRLGQVSERAGLADERGDLDCFDHLAQRVETGDTGWKPAMWQRAIGLDLILDALGRAAGGP